ncbi:hypothetical protein CYMTET_43747 [Cymbomonas tetramitiformis]|uniref:Uncharacterized protein n=1 Tax=Cymbomonas tetramitiformis TaxID=36881 RepID=A0AAE0F1C6_9CHLO|nr:hypothetical protein CYMTET_43747 [Cymbomonas tetramitiformis]
MAADVLDQWFEEVGEEEDPEDEDELDAGDENEVAELEVPFPTILVPDSSFPKVGSFGGVEVAGICAGIQELSGSPTFTVAVDASPQRGT